MPRRAQPVAQILRGLPRRAVAPRETRRKEKVQQRAAQAATRVVPKGLSYLEAATIKGSTHQDYERRVLRFIEWARVAGLD